MWLECSIEGGGMKALWAQSNRKRCPRCLQISAKCNRPSLQETINSFVWYRIGNFSGYRKEATSWKYSKFQQTRIRPSLYPYQPGSTDTAIPWKLTFQFSSELDWSFEPKAKTFTSSQARDIWRRAMPTAAYFHTMNRLSKSSERRDRFGPIRRVQW